MITFDTFGEKRATAELILERVSLRLTEAAEQPVTFDLCEEHDDAVYATMGKLEASVYPDDLAYKPREFREYVDDEESILLLLRVDGELVGYVFGYPEDPEGEGQIVEGADFFVDDAVVGLEWEARGLGTLCSMALFSLVALLGFEVVGITTEERDAAGRELVKWYHGLGFEDAVTNYCDDYALTYRLTEQRREMLLTALGARA